MKHVGPLAAALFSTLSQPALAQTADAIDRLKACSRFEGLERLKCIDERLGEMAEKPDTTPSYSSNWIVSETTSPVDYQPQIAAATTAPAASQDAPSLLAIRCRGNRIELTISTMGSWKGAPANETKVVYRINEEPPVEQRWKAAETGKRLDFPGDAVRLLRSMPEGGHMAVRVYAGKGPPHESTFQLAGLDSVRRRIAAACHRPQP
jgi:hypothetical protein